MITALDIVGRIIASQATGRIVKAIARATLRAGAKEILRAATRSGTPRRYPSTRVRRDRA